MTIHCVECGGVEDIPITPGEYEGYLYDDQPIQVSLSHLTQDHQELVQTGLCVECWNSWAKSPPDE